MEIKRVHALVFSGAGTTTAVARRFCESFAKASNQLGMPVEVEVDDITPAASAVPAIGANELVVVAVPSYGGRVPTPVASRLSRLGHVGAPAIMLVTYGNRAVDDTFIELADTLESKGMVPVGGAAVVAHHSLMTNVAQGRPDQDDLSVVDELARHASSKLAHAACASTWVFTSSNRPERFDIMPAVRMPLIQSAMALRTVSIQQSPSLAEVVDKGLEEIQEKNNVGQKLHNSTAFHGWVDKNAAWSTDI